MALEDLLLPVQRQMIDAFGYDHLRQQTGSGRALFNRLRRLGRRLHRAGARVFLAHILDDGQLRRNVFVALAGLFTDGPQILLAGGAVLFRLRQIVLDALALEMPRQRLPAAPPFLGSRSAGARSGVIVVIVIRISGSFRRLPCRLPRLPGGGKQGQLVRRELLALAVSLGIQQFSQEGLDLAPLVEFAIQLRDQVQHHLL